MNNDQTIYKCPVDGKELHNREDGREHIKRNHPEMIGGLLSQMTDNKIRKLERTGVEPEQWAAGWILGMTFRKEEVPQ